METVARHCLPMAASTAPDAAGQAVARPFLKWAGGKRQLLSSIRASLPKHIGRYFEPFVGGGAVFFSLQPERASLADINDELILAYEVVRDNPGRLITALQDHQSRHNKDHYYAVREEDPRSLEPVARAARLIYLNKTCFNGLYRVNRKGAFNVPMGSYNAPSICEPDNLRAVSNALQTVVLRCVDYKTAVAEAQCEDFVYFDPPYAPVSRSANFVSYAPGGFSEDDQAALAQLFCDLTGRGVRCMLSNSAAPVVLDLYRSFQVTRVEANRSVNSVGSGRGKVAEVIVTNY